MHFDNIVFAGGGNRCFWQAGFWSMAATALDLKPAGVASVSAGSAIACALFAGTFEHGFAGFKQAISDNKRNLYLANLLRKRPVFPHGNLYRNAILQPSQPIPAGAWDYTNHAALQATFDLGRRDGEMFCASKSRLAPFQ